MRGPEIKRKGILAAIIYLAFYEHNWPYPTLFPAFF